MTLPNHSCHAAAATRKTRWLTCAAPLLALLFATACRSPAPVLLDGDAPAEQWDCKAVGDRWDCAENTDADRE